MIQSIVKDPSHKCPLCGSIAVRSRVKAYPDVGVMSKTYCDMCGFWVCNCAFVGDGNVEYRGFTKEGVIPPDLPMVMKEDAVRWARRGSSRTRRWRRSGGTSPGRRRTR